MSRSSHPDRWLTSLRHQLPPSEVIKTISTVPVKGAFALAEFFQESTYARSRRAYDSQYNRQHYPVVIGTFGIQGEVWAMHLKKSQIFEGVRLDVHTLKRSEQVKRGGFIEENGRVNVLARGDDPKSPFKILTPYEYNAPDPFIKWVTRFMQDINVLAEVS